MPRAVPLGYQPNILVINADDAPLNWYGGMPLWAANWDSSFLDFTSNGSCNTPLCLPGRAATLTGLRVERHRGFDNSSGANLDLNNTFLMAAKRAGYRTGAAGKWINGFGESGNGGFGTQTRQPGLDWQRIMWGPPDYFDYDLLDESGALTHYGDSTANGGSDANYVTDVEKNNVLSFIGANDARPWCLYWAPKSPHKDGGGGAPGPTPAPRHASTPITLAQSASFGLDPSAYGNPPWMAASAETPWDAAAIAAVTAEHIQAMRAILSLDEAIHAVLTALNASGALAKTVVIIKTDNAHAYGEMRQTDKGTPHRGASSMMLKVRIPGVSGGSRAHAVSDIDIAPTICHLAGAQMPAAPDGMSMYRACLSSDGTHRKASPIGSPIKDSPTFRGFWDDTGRVVYEGLPGGKASGQRGSWTNFDQTTNIDPIPPLLDDLAALSLPIPS